MKKTLKSAAILLSAILLLLCLAACGEQVDPTGMWETATHLSDTTLGNGSKTVKVEIIAGEQSITLTIKTDKDNLGDALYEHAVIDDPSFFNVCNGMKGNWNRDQKYWAFKVDGRIASYGVQDQKISGGESFIIEYTDELF